MKITHGPAVLLALLVAVSSLATVRGDQSAGRGCTSITADNIDDCVRLNEIQVLGTHNSYHVAGTPPMLAALATEARNLEYTHRSLPEQLGELGVRQLEIDVFADPEGGRFGSDSAARRTPLSDSNASRRSHRRSQER